LDLFGVFICGVVVTLEYVLATAALVYSMSNYIKPLFPFVPSFIVWLIAYPFLWRSHPQPGTDVECESFPDAVSDHGIIHFLFEYAGGWCFQLRTLIQHSGQSRTISYWLPKGWQGVFAALLMLFGFTWRLRCSHSPAKNQ
jgi:ethanolamine permease